ncbi:MAG: BTAD domain-containing putative transcriptional regulator [Candidatus Levyibacteriota bacterium]
MPVPPSRLAKFSPPRASRSLPRLRLHAELDALSRDAVVWIAAGPGSGKSTLAATWAAERGDRTLWYRVDEADADPAAVFDGFAQLAATLRRGRGIPGYRPQDGAALAPFARSFFRAFFGVIPAASTLIVDDAHAAGGEFVTLLAAAIREAPHDVRMLVLGREAPSGVLHEAMARGELKAFDGAKLAFTPDEAVDLLADRVDPAKARVLCTRSDGWAGGLLLLAQSSGTSHGEDGSDPMAQGEASVKAYFSARVLELLDPAQLCELAAVSLLPDVDVEILDRMGLGPSAQATLEGMRERHAFVTRLERQRPTWKLHDLLRDTLQARFDSVGDGAWRSRMLNLAAGIAGERGLVRDAVRLHLRAGDPRSALELLEQEAGRLVRAQRLAELDAVVALIDRQAVDTSAALQRALGEAAWARNDARVAVRHLDRAWALLASSLPSAEALLVAAGAVGAILEGWQDFEGADAWARRLGAQLGARDRIAGIDDGLRVDAVCLRAMDMLWGEAPLGRAEKLIERILAVLRARDPSVSPDEALASSAVLMETAGYRLSDEALFRDVVVATLPWLHQGRISPLAEAGWLNAYAGLGRRWPLAGVKLPLPVGCLERALELGKQYGGTGAAFSAAYLLANIAISENDRALAQRRLQDLREVTNPEHGTQTVNLLLVEAAVLALGQDWHRARSTIDHADALAVQHKFPSSERWAIELTRQRIEIAAGNGEAAGAALRELVARTPEGTRRELARILAGVADAASAIASNHDPQPPLVRSIMQAASAQAWPGFATLLAPIAARICAAAIAQGIEPAFARQVVSERKLPAPTPFEPHWPWPIRVHALGTLRIEVDGEELRFGPRAQRKPLDLLKLIVVHGPAPIDTALVLDALWPDAEGGAARAAFDMTVMRMRKLLAREDALRLDGGRVGLDPGCVWVDAWAYAAGAIDTYPGPLFGADAVQPWWAGARERLHQRFLQRVRQRGQVLEQSGDLDGALAIYESGLAQDPLAEELYQAVIRCHGRAGRQADALRAFRRCREQLSIVLGVAPSPVTLALVEAVAPR